MANEKLKSALRDAGLTAEAFAEIIQVDPKSVQRWVAGQARPYPRNRASVARALDRTEHDLWPDAASQAAVADDEADDEPLAGGEVIGTWGHSNDPDAPTLADLFATPHVAVDVLEGGSGLLESPGLLDRLRQQAAGGGQVRVMTGGPTDELASLAERPGVQVRVTDPRSLAHVLIRADETMLLGLWLIGDGSPPVMQLARRIHGGLFDRLTEHFTRLWEHAQPMSAITPAADDGRADARGAETSDSPAGSERPAPRRWPRRSG